jgi:hypothetical protein
MKQSRKTWTFPNALYPEVAPLPVPLAQHLYHYWLQQHQHDVQDEVDAQAQFLLEVQEKRNNVYFVMDGFVRNREHDTSPHRLRYSTQWLRETLGKYTPTAQPIPSKTFNHWVSMGLVRNTRKGQPYPDSGAALCILRMSIEGTRLLPHAMPFDEPLWWCYAQDTLEAQPRMIPITEIPRLPASAVCWTPWAGAAWDEHWLLLSNPTGSEFYGAVRFASATTLHGSTYYNVSCDDIVSWRPALQMSFTTDPAMPFRDDEIQAFARIALIQLAQTRISLL